MKARMIFLATVMMCLAQVVTAQNLTVKVEGIESVKGKMYVSVFNSENSFLSKVYVRQVVDVTEKTLTVEFKDLPAGTYAVSLFQDENGDGKMNYGDMGMPQEPFGMSNNPGIFMGPPSFKECKFDLTENKEISISLQ